MQASLLGAEIKLVDVEDFNVDALYFQLLKKLWQGLSLNNSYEEWIYIILGLYPDFFSSLTFSL